MAEFQQIPYAEYGSQRSFYGNIQLGGAPKLFRVYGAWPEEKPVQQEMLVSDWLETYTPVKDYAEEISSRIEIIKNLQAQVAAENDLQARNLYREHIRIEREAKERAFALKARIEEEESLFILMY